MERGVPRRRRPRPVAGAGLEVVLVRAEALAKGWLLAMVEDAPREEAAAILTGGVARPEPPADQREGVDSEASPADVVEPGDALWVTALRDEIVHASRARSPLSLLLVELEEAERLIAAEARGEASVTFGRFAQAV